MPCARLLALSALALLASCEGTRPPPPAPPPPSLAAHCREVVGPPRVEQVTDRVWVARGFDLANTILIRTEEGNVVVDVGMSPPRAREVRAALLAASPGPVRAVIFTHSHIDHVGGASAWVDAEPEPPEVWATAPFAEHLFKQYGLFRAAEERRASRQFGEGLPEEDLPCVAIGRRPDVEAALTTGMRLPTRTFSGQTTLRVGGVEIELVEAPGETHDELFVWLPGEGALLPGDNVYAAFPNLYTIRGTSNRPVGAWVRSLDAMRRRAPRVLVPSHTGPVRGEAEVAALLTDYRDAIQYVHHAVLRGANRGLPLEEIVEGLRLPPHLEGRAELAPLYGELAWSARGIYTGALGWFDGRPEALYPLPSGEAAALDVGLIGEERLFSEIEAALGRSAPREALHLAAKLEAAGRAPERVRALKARALRDLAAVTPNTNGRAYLLTSARELEAGPRERRRVHVDDKLLAQVPLDVFFEQMAARLKPEECADGVASIQVVLPDEDRRYTVTQRRGVAEVVEGEPLPGTPPPLATLTVPGLVWRQLALQERSTASALLAGELDVEGDRLGLVAFLGRFDRGL